LFQAFHDKIKKLLYEVNKFQIKTNSKLIQNVCNYIIINIEKEVNLQMITDEFFVNKTYLSNLFKTEMGMGFVDFVNFAKVERAKILLHNSEMKVYEIAYKLGFTDTEYFSKVFKKATGQSPNIFKRIN
jgi:two-component system, response regulator YesN